MSIKETFKKHPKVWIALGCLMVFVIVSYLMLNVAIIKQILHTIVYAECVLFILAMTKLLYDFIVKKMGLSNKWPLKKILQKLQTWLEELDKKLNRKFKEKLEEVEVNTEAEATAEPVLVSEPAPEEQE